MIENATAAVESTTTTPEQLPFTVEANVPPTPPEAAPVAAVATPVIPGANAPDTTSAKPEGLNVPQFYEALRGAIIMAAANEHGIAIILRDEKTHRDFTLAPLADVKVPGFKKVTSLTLTPLGQQIVEMGRFIDKQYGDLKIEGAIRSACIYAHGYYWTGMTVWADLATERLIVSKSSDEKPKREGEWVKLASVKPLGALSK